MKKHGVMLVGCGTVADYGHLPAIATNSRAQLVGVVDRIAAKAELTARKFGARIWSDDYRRLLDREDIDVVVVTTPPSCHARICIDSLEAGKHVLCEKPLTSNLEDAHRVIAGVNRTGKHLMVGYILRHSVVYRKAREMIQKGKLGFPLVMRLMGAEQYNKDSQWVRALALLKDTSPLIDCGCHYVDLMRWFTNSEAVSVSGIKQRLHPDVPDDNYDYGLINVRMSDGSVGTYEVGWGYNMQGFSIKQIIGPCGRIDICYSATKEGKETVSLEYYSYPKGTRLYEKKTSIKQMDSQLSTFLRRIDNRIDPVPDLEDAIKSLEIVLAGHKAITSGKVVIVHSVGKKVQSKKQTRPT